MPLGLYWQADSFSVTMLAMTTLVAVSGGVFALGYLPAALPSADRYFWSLWLFTWSAMNSLLLAADLFNIYVGLELMALAAVGLISLSRETEALQAAMRYFLVTLFGSMLYLLGVSLLYGQYGMLDQAALATVIEPGLASGSAAVLMSLGLLIKTALFPVHFWLPSAHGRAPVPVSALLSSVVVAVCFFVLYRFWSGLFFVFLAVQPASVLGAIGLASILWGGLMALRQKRLKMIVAYSTIAQFGNVMLIFPVFAAGGASILALHGAALMVLAHGLAKAALFFAAGCIHVAHGHDRIRELPGAAGRLGWVWLAFALAGASIVGLPPSGGFVGKWRLLQAALLGEAWFWAVVMVFGALLTGAYMYRGLEAAWRPTDPEATVRTVPGLMVIVTLFCAMGAMAIGFLAVPLEVFLGQIFQPLPSADH
ncbi:complex I subunit 5 family protein [Desulfonatronum parangueonense]